MIVLIALLIIFFTFAICGMIYSLSKGKMFVKLYHDTLEWHIPNYKSIDFDGCNLYSHCKICGKEIMQDSQGNWF